MKSHSGRKRQGSNKWLKRATRKFALGGSNNNNNNTQRPADPPAAPGLPRPAPASYNTGPNHNMPVPAFDLTDPRARSPPKAPKAMTSQSSTPQTPPTSRFNPIQGVKQPPTGPKAGITPRKSPKGPKGQYGRSRAMSHSNSNPKRRKYVPARKLPLLAGGPNATSTTSNAGPSNSPRAMQSSPPKAHMRKPIPVVNHALPPKTRFPNDKRKNVPSPAKAFALHGNHDRPGFSQQPQRSQLNINPANPPSNPANAFNRTPAMRYDSKNSTINSPTSFYDLAAQPPPQAATGSEPTGRDLAAWDKYRRAPEIPASEATKAGDISLEQGHRVHPARLNYFNPNYSTPSPEPDRYLPPPTRLDRDTHTYRNGDVIGAKAREIPTTNKGRPMLEKTGYKPGLSLGKSGKEETELAVVMMKTGREGLGRGHNGSEFEGVRSQEKEGLGKGPNGGGSQGVGFHGGRTAIAVAPPNALGLSHKLEEQKRESLILKNSGYQDERILGVRKTESVLRPLGVAVQDSRRGIGTPSCGGTKERAVIIIDSDEEDESVQEVLLQEQQEDQEMKGSQGSQDPEASVELEVIAIKDDVEDSIEDEGGNMRMEDEGGDIEMEMEDAHGCVVDGSCHGSHPAQDEQVSPRLLQTPSPEYLPFPNAEGQSEGEAGLKENSQNQESATGGNFDEAAPRWKLPLFQYSPSSGRPTVPMQLFDFIIIERLEQVALVDIFHCITSFEEDSHQLTGRAFNHLLLRSFLKVRDMFMRDPLLGVDQEACEGIVKEEFGALLAHLVASSC